MATTARSTSTHLLNCEKEKGKKTDMNMLLVHTHIFTKERKKKRTEKKIKVHKTMPNYCFWSVFTVIGEENKSGDIVFSAKHLET